MCARIAYVTKLTSYMVFLSFTFVATNYRDRDRDREGRDKTRIRMRIRMADTDADEKIRMRKGGWRIKRG